MKHNKGQKLKILKQYRRQEKVKTKSQKKQKNKNVNNKTYRRIYQRII